MNLFKIAAVLGIAAAVYTLYSAYKTGSIFKGSAAQIPPTGQPVNQPAPGPATPATNSTQVLKTLPASPVLVNDPIPEASLLVHTPEVAGQSIVPATNEHIIIGQLPVPVPPATWWAQPGPSSALFAQPLPAIMSTNIAVPIQGPSQDTTNVQNPGIREIITL
jgi:hypothetical protein